MLSYDDVPICKFVYDFDTDKYKLATEDWDGNTLYYYSKPYHSDLLSDLSDDDPDVFDHRTVEAYLLLERGPSALAYQIELPAMTFSCRSEPIPTIISAFQGEGLQPQYWFNATDKELTDLNGNPVTATSDGYYDDDEDDEDDDGQIDYETVPTMKFVYDEQNDKWHTGYEPQTYYDHPHHSELMEELAESTGNWDMEGLHSGYLYLDHSPDNAITYGNHPTHPGMVMTTIPPHKEIIDHFRKQGYPVTHWYEKQPYPRNDTILHEIPQELPKSSKVAEVANFSLIKFVSLPNKFLIGENTHHAYLLSAEYGSNTFPSNTAAIGRAWLENGVIHGIGFDFGSPNAQKLAIEQLREWAQDHGYGYSDNIQEVIQGLASRTIHDQIKEVADSLQSVDYGQCYWNPNKKTVFYNAGDADDTEGIEEKFLAIPGVEHVEIGDEQGPPGGWYQLAAMPPDQYTDTQIWDWAHTIATEDGFLPPDAVSLADRAVKIWNGGLSTFNLTPEQKMKVLESDIHLLMEQDRTASAPTAFVYSNGHMYYGVDHAQIMEDHDAYEGGLYGRLHERSDGRYDLELYSDYDPNQTLQKLDEAKTILSKRFNIADVKFDSLIPSDDMADAAQFFE